MNFHKSKTASLAVALALTACNPMDPYGGRWADLKVGDSRAVAHQILGAPSSVQAIEIPLMKLEQAAWRTATGRVYLVHFALDHVVVKTIID